MLWASVDVVAAENQREETCWLKKNQTIKWGVKPDLTDSFHSPAPVFSQITKLKIDSNPFAKGFRDSSRLTDMERYMGFWVLHCLFTSLPTATDKIHD